MHRHLPHERLLHLMLVLLRPLLLVLHLYLILLHRLPKRHHLLHLPYLSPSCLKHLMRPSLQLTHHLLMQFQKCQLIDPSLTLLLYLRRLRLLQLRLLYPYLLRLYLLQYQRRRLLRLILPPVLLYRMTLLKQLKLRL
ncbi:hypothetical protein CA831_29285 [Burkholderia multivorans]|nr:hypothetical protein CA831_29285 [Burkholderia multivorans]